jgi:hypothetical protein
MTDPHAHARQLRWELAYAVGELGPLEHSALYLDASGARRVAATLRRQLARAEEGAT